MRKVPANIEMSVAMNCRTIVIHPKRLGLSGLVASLVISLFGLMALPASAGQHCVTCDAPAATYLCEAQNGPGILAANGGQLACITELAKRGGHDSCSVIRRAASQCDGLVPTVLFPGTGDADINAAVGTQPQPTAPQPPATMEPGPGLAEPVRPSTPPSAAPDGVATSGTDTFTPDDGTLDSGIPADQAEAGAKPDDTEEARRGPPKTVAEMAGRAYEDSKKGLGKAGKAVGDTAKSAGDVVTDTAKKTGDQIGKAGKAVGNAASKTWDCVTSLFSDC